MLLRTAEAFTLDAELRFMDTESMNVGYYWCALRHKLSNGTAHGELQQDGNHGSQARYCVPITEDASGLA